jgi:hypothetical protein
MMARLRDQRSSGGSRRIKIEAPDGSLEVKKRKRRSHQPIKERQQLLGRLRKNLLLVAIPAILLLIGSYLLLNVRYQGDSFRSALSKQASELIGAPTEIAPLNIKGLNVRSRRVFIEPYSPSLLQSAEFTSVNGKLTSSSLFSSDWHLTNLNSLHGKLRFHAPARSLAGGGQSASGSTGIPLTVAGLGFSSKPSAFVIDQLRVGSIDFAWTNGLKEFVFLEEATITSQLVGARTDMHVADAKLKFGDWPEFDLETAKVSFTKSGIRVDDALMRHSFIGSQGGDATLSGIVDLAGRAPIADFTCQLDAMPAMSLVESAWKGKLEGDIDATLRFQADLSDPGSLKISGPFWIRNGSFGDINPTKRLAVFLAEPEISRVDFHSIRGDITIEDGTRTVDNIEANAPNLVRIKGSYTIKADGLLSGSLNLSVANEILEKLPGGMPEFFTGEESPGGMSVTTVQIGGTSSEPTEDLTERLEKALEKFERESAAPPASSYPTIPLSPDAERMKVRPAKE